MITLLKKILGLGPSVNFAELAQQGAIILDVRSKAEFSGGHIKGSVNIPVQVLQNNLGQRVWTSVIEPNILAKQLKTCEVAVGALRNEIGRAPIVVTEEMVMNMRPGSIIIDVAVDRGGCFETTELTNHENPIVIKHDVIHYGVPNIPSGFARTASQAISNVLMHLMVEVGDQGSLEELIWHQLHLREGVYLYKGSLTDFYISQKCNLKYTDLNLLIASRS